MRAAHQETTPLPQSTCDSVDWYEGDDCVLPPDHVGLHRDAFGATWEHGASERSLLRVHGPWWPEKGHVLAKYLPKDQ